MVDYINVCRTANSDYQNKIEELFELNPGQQVSKQDLESFYNQIRGTVGGNEFNLFNVHIRFWE